MSSPPRVARATRQLGRLHGLNPWLRLLRPARTLARRLLLRAYPPERGERFAGAVAPVARGLRMRLDPRSYIEWEVLFCGYEPEVRELIRRSVGQGGNAIDVGANAGAHTLAMLTGGGAVLACEPNPLLRARLEDNLLLNGVEKVQVVPYALGARAGSAVLHVPADPVHTGGASLVGGIHEHLRNAIEVQVEVKTLDDLVDELRLGTVRLVKVDVEGLEADVLAGARRLLGRDHPDLAFEYTRDWWRAAGASLEGTLAELGGLGYKVRMITWRGLRPIPDPAPDRMNLWANARSSA